MLAGVYSWQLKYGTYSNYTAHDRDGRYIYDGVAGYRIIKCWVLRANTIVSDIHFMFYRVSAT